MLNLDHDVRLARAISTDDATLSDYGNLDDTYRDCYDTKGDTCTAAANDTDQISGRVCALNIVEQSRFHGAQSLLH